MFNVIQFKGFDFVFDNRGKVVLWKTGLKSFFELPLIIKSFISICRTIKKENPDVIFNFYEPLIGLTSLFFPKIKYVAISHQYAIDLKEYPKIQGFYIQKIFIKLLNYITSLNSKKIILSYYDVKSKDVVCPPILRQKSYTRSSIDENFILVYLMHENLIPQLIDEAIKYPNLKIECFTKLTKTFDCPSNLKVNNLNGDLFQERMKVCSSVICSGGFETASEAILQHKPLLMIPMKNHYEQYANANDAKLHGFAEWNDTVDLSLIPKKQLDNDAWFNKVKPIIENIL